MNKKRLLAVAVSGTLLSGMIAATMQSATAADASAAAPVSTQTAAAVPPDNTAATPYANSPMAGVATQGTVATPSNAPTNTQAAAVATPNNTTAAPSNNQANNQAAATTPQAKSAENDQKTEKDWLKVSDDAMTSMYDLNRARHAIFNGNPAQARTFLDAAVTRIDAASKDAQQYALDVKAPRPGDQYVPFNTSLTVLDTIKPTDAKAEHLAKANDHLQKGEKQKAMEELQISEVDAAITTSLIPVNFAKAQITQAAELAKKGQYYEANLALKAVDDSVLMQVFDLDNLPKASTQNTANVTNKTPSAPATAPAQQG